MRHSSDFGGSFPPALFEIFFKSLLNFFFFLASFFLLVQKQLKALALKGAGIMALFLAAATTFLRIFCCAVGGALQIAESRPRAVRTPGRLWWEAASKDVQPDNGDNSPMECSYLPRRAANRQ